MRAADRIDSAPEPLSAVARDTTFTTLEFERAGSYFSFVAGAPRLEPGAFLRGHTWQLRNFSLSTLNSARKSCGEPGASERQAATARLAATRSWPAFACSGWRCAARRTHGPGHEPTTRSTSKASTHIRPATSACRGECSIRGSGKPGWCIGTRYDRRPQARRVPPASARRRNPPLLVILLPGSGPGRRRAALLRGYAAFHSARREPLLSFGLGLVEHVSSSASLRFGFGVRRK